VRLCLTEAGHGYKLYADVQANYTEMNGANRGLKKRRALCAVKTYMLDLPGRAA